MPNDTTKAAPDERGVLKPCPFCGGVDIWPDITNSPYGLYCDTCDSSGPPRSLGDSDDAINAWNTRTPPQVKPLVWSTGKSFCSSAHVSFGTYHARWDDGIGAWYGSLELGKHDNPFILEMADVQTEHEAQEACQADYTRRILDALA